MRKEYPAVILRTIKDSLAEEIGLVAGDKIWRVNDAPMRDIIDLSFLMADEEIELLVEHTDGEKEIIAFDKDIDEELGAEFQSAVFDSIRSCANHCYFCFVDMIAPHMRQSLSIKDDDYRLSFLYGNFVTLTNMCEADFKRIEAFHLSPLYVSVQCMNPKLRAEMLRCEKAAEIAAQLDRLEGAGADYHTQVVLCAGLNDGEELERTIREIAARRPHALDLAIVPVGITKYRTDPFPLKQFDQASAARVIEKVERWQEKLREEMGRTFIYLGDEFYFLAGREVPPSAYYDGFPQLDNGIGLTRNFINAWENEEKKTKVPVSFDEPVTVTIISGTSVAPVLARLANSLCIANLKIRVLPVENRHFGTTVNVSGLLTAGDIRHAVETTDSAGNLLLIPESALRSGEDVFLDDVSLKEFQAYFPASRVEPVNSGSDFYRALTDAVHYHKDREGETAYMWQSNAGYTKNLTY